MANLHLDGFAHYGTKDNLGLVYSINTNGNGVSYPVNDPAVFARPVLRVENFGNVSLNFSAAQTHICAGMRFKTNALPSTHEFTFLLFWGLNTAANKAMCIFVLPSGAIGINDNGGFLQPNIRAQSAPAVISADVFYYIEIEYNCVTHIYDVYVNGGLVLSYESDNLQTEIVTFAPIRYYAQGVDRIAWITDFYVNNTTGTKNNGLMGEIAALTSFPASDSVPQDWTLSSGADAYALLDNGTPDDANYIESAAADETARFGVDQLPITVGAIYSAQLYVRAKKDIAGAGEFYASLIGEFGGSTSSISFTPSTASGYFKSTPIEENPDGGILTRNAFNAGTIALTRSV